MLENIFVKTVTQIYSVKKLTFLKRNSSNSDVLSGFSLEKVSGRVKIPGCLSDDTFKIRHFFEIFGSDIFIRFDHSVDFFFELFDDLGLLKAIEEHGCEEIGSGIRTSNDKSLDFIDQFKGGDLKLRVLFIPFLQKQLNQAFYFILFFLLFFPFHLFLKLNDHFL